MLLMRPADGEERGVEQAYSHVPLLDVSSGSLKTQSLPRVLDQEPPSCVRAQWSQKDLHPAGMPPSFLPPCPYPMLFSEAAIFQVATHLFIFETSKCVEIQISAFGFSKERKILLCEVVPQDK